MIGKRAKDGAHGISLPFQASLRRLGSCRHDLLNLVFQAEAMTIRP